jgi:hypothetical protein
LIFTETQTIYNHKFPFWVFQTLGDINIVTNYSWQLVLSFFCFKILFWFDWWKCFCFFSSSKFMFQNFVLTQFLTNLCFNLFKETRFKLKLEKLWCFNSRIKYVRTLFIISDLLVMPLIRPSTISNWICIMVQWLEKWGLDRLQLGLDVCIITVLRPKPITLFTLIYMFFGWMKHNISQPNSDVFGLFSWAYNLVVVLHITLI